MSLIAKQVKRRSTRQVAAPVTAETVLSPEAVIEVVQQIVQASTDEAERQAATARAKAEGKKGLAKTWHQASDRPNYHLHLAKHSDGWTVSYPYPISAKVTPARGRWVARIQTSAGPAGATLVKCELIHWVERDGALANKEMYLKFLDQLAQRLAT